MNKVKLLKIIPVTKKNLKDNGEAKKSNLGYFFIRFYLIARVLLFQQR